MLAVQSRMAPVARNICVGLTDDKWFDFLAHEDGVDEVNFWRPSPRAGLQGLQPGDLFLFRLHAPVGKIAGGGYFTKYLRMPVGYAWTAFGRKNGADSLDALRRNIAHFRGGADAQLVDFTIGCIMLASPFFFEQDQWFTPPNWQPGIRSVKYYRADDADGQQLEAMVRDRIIGRQLDEILAAREEAVDPKMVLVKARTGQGYFSSVVADAYNWRCAVTGERVLPTLDAAHVLPVKEKGPNIVQNGLLLRTDIHRLFDAGYATIERDADDVRLVVSRRINEEFNNGKEYLAMAGKLKHLPIRPVDLPDQEFIAWHNGRFRG